MRRLIVLSGLLLSGCAQHGFAAFVVNQDAHSASKPGKSYSAEPCTLQTGPPGTLFLRSGQSGQPSAMQLRVTLPSGQSLESILGRTIEGATGDVQLEQRLLKLEKGTFTLQTVQSGVARGNFNARAKDENPPWEVVGSFEARLQ